MGRKRQGRVLDVYVGSSKVGRYARAPDGATSFRYDPEWLSSDRSFPISLSMPLSDRIWSGEAATSYFDGLLPDDRTVREKIAAREHAESAGIFICWPSSVAIASERCASFRKARTLAILHRCNTGRSVTMKSPRGWLP